MADRGEVLDVEWFERECVAGMSRTLVVRWTTHASVVTGSVLDEEGAWSTCLHQPAIRALERFLITCCYVELQAQPSALERDIPMLLVP